MLPVLLTFGILPINDNRSELTILAGLCERVETTRPRGGGRSTMAAEATTPTRPPVVKTSSGSVEGRWNGEVAEFLGIPFAAPPVGERRFASPAPAEQWDGVRRAVEGGPACIQLPSRGEAVMGPMQVPGYDEDCLYLNVWSPNPGGDARLPVLVWFHGGGFLFGAGSASFYEGSVLARRGDIVVVTVNYRLGAFGYLYLAPGLRAADAVSNLGLQDQCAALEWVRENIADFGGDPDCVTVAGQSAGGISIVGLAAMPRAQGLFRRAILQSSGPGVPARTVDEAAHATELFLAAIGVQAGDVDALLAPSSHDVNNAQALTLMNLVMEAGFDPRIAPGQLAMPFQLVTDGTVLPVEPTAAAFQHGSMDDLDLLIMCTSEEMRFALAFDESFWQLDGPQIRTQLELAGKPQRLELFEAYGAAHPGATPAEVLCELIADEVCIMPCIRFAEHCAAIGRPAHFAWFTWRSPAAGGRLGACHTAELPFIFDNFEQWTAAPLLAGVDEAELRRLGDSMQDAWVEFIATGAAPWLAYTPDERHAMEFGATTTAIHDPNGGNRSLWHDKELI
jgi:para-nitrobenzyl esterase